MSINPDDLATVRRRPLEEHHKRSMEMQALDALLRIEELLTKLVATKDQDDTSVDGNVEDVITNVKPQSTPFSKAVAAKPKGARGGVTRL